MAYEGAHKITGVFIPHKKEHVVKSLDDKKPSPEEVLTHEKTKIKSAIFTDFVLSIEIIIIAMNSVPEDTDFVQKIIVVSIIALLAIVGVYGIVALIVRMDDFGYKLINKGGGKNGLLTMIGKLLVNGLPWIIKTLNVVGTLALLLVAGGIFTHKIDFFHHLWESWNPTAKDFVVGLIIGFAVYLVLVLGQMIWKGISKK